MSRAKMKAAAAQWLEARQDKPHIDTSDLIDLEQDISKLEFKTISDETVVLNDEKAAAYIELPVFRGEREVRESHVQRLYDELKKGNFNSLLVILASAEFEGIVYKINGQHTAWSKFYLPGYEPKVREIKFKVNSAEQLRQLYATFDRGLGRSDKHLTLVELSNNPHLREITPTTLKFMSSAMKYWLFDTVNARKRCSPQDLASIVAGPHLSLFKQTSEFVQVHVNKMDDALIVRRVPVVGALIETFSKVPTKAPDFWEPVCSGIGLESKVDARYQLRQFLLTAKLNSTSSRHVRSVDGESMYNHVIPAFNKWRKGEPVKSLRPTSERVKAI